MSDKEHISTWPRVPFLQPIVASDVDPEWMIFFSAGRRFEGIQSTIIRWQISALLLRLSDLEDATPCPPSFVLNSGVILKLSIREEDPPTTALCIRALILFELLIVRWGNKEIAFRFGHGFDLIVSQATFEIKYKMV